MKVGVSIYYKGDVANVSGNGFVVAIREHANPARMFSMDFAAGKLVPFDSSKSYDIVLEDGRRFNGVYESNIGGERNNHSCRFMLGDALPIDEGGIAVLVARSVEREANLKAKAEVAAALFAKAKDEAKAAGVKLGLVPAADFKGRGSAAASNLRAELKAAGVKCSVKADGYDCLRVKLAAGASAEAAKKIAAKYQAGHFDGMSDCYEYDPSSWGSVFGDVRYVFVSSDAGYLV